MTYDYFNLSDGTDGNSLLHAIKTWAKPGLSRWDKSFDLVIKIRGKSMGHSYPPVITLSVFIHVQVNLYPTFGGPWADTPCRPQDIDFHVPHEYLTNQTIRYTFYLLYYYSNVV